MSRGEEESRLTCDVSGDFFFFLHCDVLAVRVIGLVFVSGDLFFFSRHLSHVTPIFFPEHFVWQGSKQIGHVLVGGVDESPHTEQVEAAGYMPESRFQLEFGAFCDVSGVAGQPTPR